MMVGEVDRRESRRELNSSEGATEPMVGVRDERKEPLDYVGLVVLTAGVERSDDERKGELKKGSWKWLVLALGVEERWHLASRGSNIQGPLSIP